MTMNTVPLTEQTEQQIAQYETYAEADPDNYLIWLTLGDLNHSISRLERAGECYARCLELSPDSAVVRGRMASLCITQHRFAEAEAQLRAIIDSGETDPTLVHNLGVALFYQERWDEAEASFRRALDAGLNDPSTLSYLCKALHQQARFDEAVDVCQDWVAAADTPESRGFLALFEMDRNNMAKAEEIAAEVLASAPDDVNAANVMGNAALERQDINTADAHFQRMVQRQPDNARAWLGLGLASLYRGQHAEAVASLEKAMRLDPAHSGTVVALGWTLLSQQDFAGAEQVFRRAIDVDRNFSESHGGLAAALAFQNKTEEAKAEIRRARHLDPGGFGAEFAQSILLTARGERQNATKMLAELLERPPGPGQKPLIEQIRHYFKSQADRTPASRDNDLPD